MRDVFLLILLAVKCKSRQFFVEKEQQENDGSPWGVTLIVQRIIISYFCQNFFWLVFFSKSRSFQTPSIFKEKITAEILVKHVSDIFGYFPYLNQTKVHYMKLIAAEQYQSITKGALLFPCCLLTLLASIAHVPDKFLPTT